MFPIAFNKSADESRSLIWERDIWTSCRRSVCRAIATINMDLLPEVEPSIVGAAINTDLLPEVEPSIGGDAINMDLPPEVLGAFFGPFSSPSTFPGLTRFRGFDK